MSPTYELAMQTGRVAEQMGKHCPHIRITYAVRGHQCEYVDDDDDVSEGEYVDDNDDGRNDDDDSSGHDGDVVVMMMLMRMNM